MPFVKRPLQKKFSAFILAQPSSHNKCHPTSWHQRAIVLQKQEAGERILLNPPSTRHGTETKKKNQKTIPPDVAVAAKKQAGCKSARCETARRHGLRTWGRVLSQLSTRRRSWDTPALAQDIHGAPLPPCAPGLSPAWLSPPVRDPQFGTPGSLPGATRCILARGHARRGGKAHRARF